jgi:peptidoglycan L-alanyl-D-glutamate endopeptidase CwlK
MNNHQLNKYVKHLHPILQEKIISVIDSAAHNGWKYYITSGVRTIAEQDAIYQIGRSKPGKLVTNARGGQSYHNFGCAVDVV